MSGLNSILTTNAGLNLLRDAEIGANSANPLAQYIAVGTGAAVLSAGVTNGTPITSLPVNALPATISAGQSLTIIYQTHYDTVTVAAGGASMGATSIPINSWTPSYSFPSGSGLVNTPAHTDTQLQAEVYRAPIASATAGGSVGEAIVSMYVTAAAVASSYTFLEFGLFAGAATSSANSGTLMRRFLGWFAYTPGSTAGLVQFDYTMATA